MSIPRGFALITGASAGIGETFARQLAQAGHPLVLCARRRDRLEALAADLSQKVRCEIVVADLEAPDSAERLAEELERRGIEVGYLVNNAGYGVPGEFLSKDWQVHQRSLQLMLTGVCELSWRLLPGMRQRGFGRVINVASLAGHLPGSAGHTLYAAIKSFLIKFSQSLALENETHGVKVMALCPGFTYSEFHDVTGTRGQVSKMPSYMWMTAEDVVRDGLRAIERGEIVHINGRLNRMIARLFAWLPSGLALRLIRKQSKNFRKL
ncbi:SDR family NAD(P)-dependent oxidoreductase [Pseudomarimonas arenosa]|uniref:SDR family oxidoreductase n=1 Tax=Pseudomarimonas arenosa TaxID=2774145 RepID=A0AAW3ZRG5_9GAMM|nr:SDR family oxidoreductase [Pseudomarimonas arenosa]MBD8526836.1 SDR family oxidoreductase [Pseudomarimonas arenosa]